MTEVGQEAAKLRDEGAVEMAREAIAYVRRHYDEGIFPPPLPGVRNAEVYDREAAAAARLTCDNILREFNERLSEQAAGVVPLPPASREPVDVAALDESTVASVWVAEFIKVVPDADEGLMLGWFANAIERGRRAGYSEGAADASALLAESPAAPVSLPAPKLADAPTPINLIANLLRAGQVVGLDPREMMKNALDELAREYDVAESKNAPRVSP